MAPVKNPHRPNGMDLRARLGTQGGVGANLACGADAGLDVSAPGALYAETGQRPNSSM